MANEISCMYHFCISSFRGFYIQIKISNIIYWLLIFRTPIPYEYAQGRCTKVNYKTVRFSRFRFEKYFEFFDSFACSQFKTKSIKIPRTCQCHIGREEGGLSPILAVTIGSHTRVFPNVFLPAIILVLGEDAERVVGLQDEAGGSRLNGGAVQEPAVGDWCGGV